MTQDPIYASQARPWLKYYDQKYIEQTLPTVSAFEYVCQRNKNHLNDTALDYYGRKFTYADLIVNVKKTAAALRGVGVQKGDIITVVSVMTPEVIALFYAADMIGATLNLVDPRYSVEGIHEYIEEVDSHLLVCLNVVYERCRQAAKRTNVEKVIVLSPADSLPPVMAVGYRLTTPDKNKYASNAIRWKQFIANGKNQSTAAEPYDPDHACVVVHTGGTTGSPKGVMLTDNSFNAIAQQFRAYDKLFHRGQKLMNIMPPFIAYGYACGVHLPLVLGFTVIIIPNLDPAKLGSLVLKYKPEHMFGVPAHYQQLAADPKLRDKDLSFILNYAAGGVVEDEGEVLIPQLGVSGQLLVVGGHAEHMLGLVLEHQTAQLGRVEVGDDDDREAQHQRQMDAAGVAVGNEGGHDIHELLAPVEQLIVGTELLRDGVEAVVGEHDALGRAGGAAGVDHDTGMVGVVRLGSGALVLAVCDELLPADGVGGVLVLVGGGQPIAHGHHRGQGVGRREDDDLFHVGALGGLTAALVHDVQADQKMGVHLLDVLVDAFDTVAGVYEVQGGADHVCCIEQGDDLGGHDAHHRYDVALLDADAPQGGGGLLDVDDEVSIGELPAVVIQRGVVQMVFVPLADIFECRDGGKGLLNVLLVVIFEPRPSLRCVNGILRHHRFLIPLCL